MDIFHGLGSTSLVSDGQSCSAAHPETSSSFSICDKIYKPDDKETRFPTYPAGFSFPSSQCFAASFPVSLEQSPQSGPSGIFCSSTDFVALFSRNKTELGNAGTCCANIQDHVQFNKPGGSIIVGRTYDCLQFCGSLRKSIASQWMVGSVCWRHSLSSIDTILFSLTFLPPTRIDDRGGSSSRCEGCLQGSALIVFWLHGHSAVWLWMVGFFPWHRSSQPVHNTHNSTLCSKTQGRLDNT